MSSCASTLEPRSVKHGGCGRSSTYPAAAFPATGGSRPIRRFRRRSPCPRSRCSSPLAIASGSRSEVCRDAEMEHDHGLRRRRSGRDASVLSSPHHREDRRGRIERAPAPWTQSKPASSLAIKTVPRLVARPGLRFSSGLGAPRQWAQHRSRAGTLSGQMRSQAHRRSGDRIRNKSVLLSARGRARLPQRDQTVRGPSSWPNRPVSDRSVPLCQATNTSGLSTAAES